MKTRLRILSIAVILIMCTCTGCVSKAKYNDLVTQYNALADRYNAATENFSGAGVTCLPSGNGQFTNKDGVMYVFPASFGFPGAESGVPGYRVLFNDGACELVPTSGWIVYSVGSVLYVYNQELDISGQFSAGRHTDGTATDKDTLRSYLQDWISQTGTNIQYSDIYLGDAEIAGQAVRCATAVNGADSVVNCGLIGDNRSDISYVFMYKGTENEAKQQSIQALLMNLKINDKGLRIM